MSNNRENIMQKTRELIRIAKEIGGTRGVEIAECALSIAESFSEYQGEILNGIRELNQRYKNSLTK